MALTANATKHIVKDILSNLNLKDCIEFWSSFNRPNLIYEVREWKKQNDEIEVCNEIVKFLKEKNYMNSSGIIYCLKWDDCELITRTLKDRYQMKVEYYHADMKDERRKYVQGLRMGGKIHIIVATIAFGMGINKQDVRFVIHTKMPKCLLNYN